VRNESNEIDDLLTERLRTGFPNPDRLGCPSREFLRGLAKHKIPIEKTEAWLDHLVTCSQCFSDYTRFSTVEAQRRRRFIALGGVAALLCIILLSEYVWYRQSGSTGPSNHQIARTNTPHNVTPDEIAVTIQLENMATIRGEDLQNHSTITLARGVLQLLIYLPANSRSGAYTVELLKQFTDTKALLTVSGRAEIKDGHAVLRASADLRSVPTGSYYLALRGGGGDWRYYRVMVS